MLPVFKGGSSVVLFSTASQRPVQPPSIETASSACCHNVSAEIDKTERLRMLRYRLIFRRKFLTLRHLEARGVEPLSLKPLPQASTCVAGNEDSGFCCEPARYSHPIVHEFDSPAGAVNPPAN